MRQIIFYHDWKEGMEISHHWFHVDVPLKLITDNLPEKLVYKNSPHIHWMTFTDWKKEEKENKHFFIKLPSLHHVPIMGSIMDEIPNGYGIMILVVDFDWVYFIKNDHVCSDNNLIQLSQKMIYLENKLTDRNEWIKLYIQPSWEIFQQNHNHLDLYQRRIFFGLSKVLGKWEMCQRLLLSCEFPSMIMEYDKAEISYHLHNQLPLLKRKQLFFQHLLKNDEYWIEKWWEMLECIPYHVDKNLLLNILLKKTIQYKNQEWYKKMPLCRWVQRKLLDEQQLFSQETILFRQFSCHYNQLKMNYLFPKVLTMENISAFFTYESTHFIKKLITMNECETGNLLASQDDFDYVPSSSGIIVYPENPQWYVVNIRKVNYRILNSGVYVTIKNGNINPVYNGISKNEFYFMHRETLKPVSPIRPMKEDISNKQTEEIAIVGLEDVRLVPSINQDILFYGVTKSYSYSDAIRIITGRYDVERACFHDTKVIHPPYEENACEKNWTWCGNNRFIYRWNPIEIGYIDMNNKLVIDERIQSPFYFKEFRGSSPAVLWKNFHFFSVHSVTHGENGRKYLHSIVVLDLLSEHHQVIGVTSPFCFENVQIEYSIGMDIYKGMILFIYSTRDSTSRYIRLPISSLLEDMYFINHKTETQFKTQIFQDLY